VRWRRRQELPPRRSSDYEHERKESIVNELAEIEMKAEESDEDARIYAWRVEQLSGLGLSGVVASAVASFVDWHELARLIERGCSPELALEIVR
jgi:predicted component of type VI protein secretion system